MAQGGPYFACLQCGGLRRFFHESEQAEHMHNFTDGAPGALMRGWIALRLWWRA
jgi:hypothetical protein